MPPKSKKEKSKAYQEKDDEAAKDRCPNVARDRSPVASQGHSHSEITREALHSEGWRITQVPEDMRRCYVPRSRRIPSPMIPQTDLKDGSLRVVNNHVHDGVHRLFHEVRTDAERIKSDMLGDDAVSNHRAFPYLCIFGNTFGKAEVREGPRGEVEPCIIPIAGPVTPPDQEQQEPTPSLEGNARKDLTIRRLRNTQTSEIGYFIVNKDLENLAINESAVSPNLIAGPLPNFAVITVGSIAVLWFRTLSALTYTPDARPVLDTALIRSLLQEPTKRPTTRKRKGPFRTWNEILDQGLERHRQESAADGNKEPFHREQIHDASDMEITEVWLAIGSIWAALRKHVLNAYARLEYFFPQGATENIISAAGSGRPFPIPLLFPAADPGAVGHLMLAVACLQGMGEDRQIQVKFYDSLRGFIGYPSIRRRTREIISTSEWANPNGEESQTVPRYTMEEYVTIPQQQPGSNTCGMYTILNAWAVMLGIPVRPYTLRRGYKSDEEFAKVGREIINLVLGGHMDSRTIQAFMNVYGYAASQHPDDEEDDVSHKVDAVRMWQGRLEQLLQNQFTTDKTGIQLTPSPDKPYAPTTIHFSEESIGIITSLGATRDQAIEVLRDSGGNVEVAGDKFWASRSKSPEDFTQPGPSSKPDTPT